MNFAKADATRQYFGLAQLERLPNQSSKNWKAKTCVLHCGGRCKSTYPSLCRDTVTKTLENVEKHSKSTRPENHCWIEQNLPEQCCRLIWRPVVYPKNGIITGDNLSVSLANIAVHYMMQPIAGVLCEAELFHIFIDDIIWIVSSESSNESIRQVLTSAFAKSRFELTFRQAFTADQKGEVQFRC